MPEAKKLLVGAGIRGQSEISRISIIYFSKNKFESAKIVQSLRILNIIAGNG
jgi:hypothetical protein